MKVIVLLTLLFAGSALAQNHMFEFNGESILLGQYSFSESKESDEEKESDQSGFLSFNFARAVSNHVQVGVLFNYARNASPQVDSEAYGTSIGAIYNFSESDFTNSLFASFYVGMLWRHSYWDDFPDRHHELLVTRTSFGKRFPIAFISENFTYSPEVSVSFSEATTSRSEWRRDFTLKFLQFAVFF